MYAIHLFFTPYWDCYTEGYTELLQFNFTIKFLKIEQIQNLQLFRRGWNEIL